LDVLFRHWVDVTFDDTASQIGRFEAMLQDQLGEGSSVFVSA
jgi:hypothetical protein